MTRWFTYLTRDLVQAVDAHLRTIPTASGRGIGGYSSGADAALNAILLRPDLYSVAEGWSGDYRQTPATVDRDAALVRRFSALDTAPRRARAGRDRCSCLSLRGPARSRHAEHDARRARTCGPGRCTRSWT